MFERFTDRARQVVALAQDEARMLNHNYIGTEHILLGLIHGGEGVAAKALESLGISLAAVRLQVETIIGQGQQAPTGHILLGLIRAGDGVAAQVLVRLGADLSRVRQQVIQLLSDDALARVDSLDRRLTAIERWVGMRSDLDDLDQEIAQVRREKEAAIDRQDFPTAAATRDKAGRGALSMVAGSLAVTESEFGGIATALETGSADDIDGLSKSIEVTLDLADALLGELRIFTIAS